MLGLVASMGIASASDETAATTPPVGTLLADPPQITTSQLTTSQLTTPATTATSDTAPASAEPAPVTLTVRPDVRVVAPPAAQASAPAPAPAATTSGSR
jgi:hypothetical protein